MNRIKGEVLSPGVGRGIVKRYLRPVKTAGAGAFEPVDEIARLKDALSTVRSGLSELKESVDHKEADMLLQAYSLVFEDENLAGEIEECIAESKCDAGSAVIKVFDTLSAGLKAGSDELSISRALEIDDIKTRIVNLLDHPEGFVLNEDTILVSPDILPSDILSITKDRLKGIVVSIGSVTGHAAILAKGLGIPVLKVRDISELKEGVNAVIDCNEAYLALGDDAKEPETVTGFRDRYIEDLKKKHRFASKLYLNIASADECKGKDFPEFAGVGLFRTEFMYMTHTPTEEELFEAFRTVLECFGDRPVIVRTFDFGEDKVAPCVEHIIKDNPKLRGIRLAVFEEILLVTMFKALLRASVYGNLRVMIPMAGSVKDIDAAEDLILRARVLLNKENKTYRDFPLGIMVETVESIKNIDELAKRSAFFSIGTNDLAAQLIGKSRTEGSSRLSFIQRHRLLKAVKAVTQAAKAHDIPVGVCGELAGDPGYAIRFSELGVDYLSVSGQS